MKPCPSCQTENSDTARFCVRCAGPLVSELFCPACGTANAVNAYFCHHCSGPLRGTSATPLTRILPSGMVLAGRYVIVNQLGKGGMGTVYRARDARLTGKEWAIKVMSTEKLLDPGEQQRAVQAFQQEAALLAALDHPHLTDVADYFSEGAQHYLVMGLVQGQTLAALLESRPIPFPEAQVLKWAGQLCEVLTYLHTRPQPIIFRDLKPANIMITPGGDAMLIDFGIVRLFKPGKTTDTEPIGTPGYAAPEQYGRKQTDARSDVYGLGATLHQLLTLCDPADQPFLFAPVTTLNPKVSPHVNAAIMKALAQEPGERWSSIAEMKKALLAPSAVKPDPQKKQRNNWLIGAALLGGLGLLGLSCVGMVVIYPRLFPYATPTLTPSSTATSTPMVLPTLTLPPLPTPSITLSPTDDPASYAIVETMSGETSALTGAHLVVGQVLEVGNGEGSFLQVSLPDGSILYLGEGTRVVLTEMGVSQTSVALEEGTLLLSGQAIRVTTASPNSAARLLGGVMGVTYQPLSKDFWVDCLDGACTVGEGDQLTTLMGGQRTGLFQGTLTVPEEADYGPWLALGQTWVPTPTLTFTPTPTFTATATPRPTIKVPTPTPTRKPTKEQKEEEPPPPYP